MQAGLALHHLEHVAGLVGHRVDRRAGDVLDPRVAGQAEDGAARMRIPVRRAEADERRHQVDAAGIGHRLHQPLDVGRGGDGAQPVAQPLHGRAGDEHRPFERVGGAAAEPPGDRGQQALGRGHRPLAGVEQHEAAGAVGVLGGARLEAGLAEERRLLVAGRAGNRNRRRRADRRRCGRRPRCSTRTSGSIAARHVEQRQQLVVPVARCGCCRAASGWRCSRR